MMRFVNPFLKWLSLGVYGSFLPMESNPGAEFYLIDLWKLAPKRVALTHTLLAMSPLFLAPLILKKICLYPTLPLEKKEIVQKKMMFSSLYLLRLIAYGLRGHALVATLRDENTRKKVLQPTEDPQRRADGPLHAVPMG